MCGLLLTLYSRPKKQINIVCQKRENFYGSNSSFYYFIFPAIK